MQDMKVKVRVPRVRNRETDKEVLLSTYRKLQEPLDGDKNLLVKVLNGLSCHKYCEAAQKVPEVFGLSASSISKRYMSGQVLKSSRSSILGDWRNTILLQL